MSEYSISILAYQNFALTQRCINSVIDAGGDYELILTDNGCTDGTGKYFDHLQKSLGGYRRVTVIHNKTNLGFIDPSKVALGFSTSPFHVLLNNDTLVCPKWLNMLRSPFQTYPMAALSGPRARCTALSDKMRGIPGYRVEYLEGSCLMGRTSLLKQHGLFSPELRFAYGEDSDLSLRMRELGYTIHQVPFTLPFHAGGATTRTVPPAFLRPIIKANHEYLMKRWAAYLANPDRLFPHEAGQNLPPSTISQAVA